MAAHEADWVQDDSVLTSKQQERGYSGYRCRTCGITIAVSPGAMPQLGARHT